MHRVMSAIGIVSLALLATAGCQSATGQSLGTTIDNKTTTVEVKAKLVADRLQNLTWVDVDTRDGVVYLTGNAATEAQKERAGEIARGVRGVTKVVNNIQVTTAAASSSTAPAASPGAFQGRHTMTGQVTSVDHDNGHLGLKTDEGNLMLHFPPSALTGVKPGDHVTVDLGIRSAQ